MYAKWLARAHSLPLAFLAVAGVALVQGNEGLPQWLTASLLLAAFTVGVGTVATRPADMLAVLALSVPVQDLGAVDVVGVSIPLTRLCLGCLVVGWARRVACGKRVAIDSVECCGHTVRSANPIRLPPISSSVFRCCSR